MTTWEPPHRIAIAAAQQTWESVAFVHWRDPPAVIDGLLPRGVEVDTIDGTAWAGLTPFRMQAAVIPLVARPAVATAEINVRTYARVRGMPQVVYTQQRVNPRRVRWEMAIDLGRRVPVDEVTDLDVFLLARWRAFTRLFGRTVSGPVEHRPWPLRRAEIAEVSGDLLAAVDLPPPDAPPDVRFSDGVHARLGLPRPAPPAST